MMATNTFSRSAQRRRSQTVGSGRLWEVDAARGVAIVMMVIYHLVYDLYYFGVSDAIFTNPFWFYFQRVTASAFILLVGVSLALRVQRIDAAGQTLAFAPFARRGLLILGWGIVITLITWLVLGPAMAIRFGILHFIGISIMLAYPFVRWRQRNLALGLALFVAGKIVQQLSMEQPWLLWIGVESVDHVYVDYFPLLPWFGVVLIGIWLGNTAYHDAERHFQLPDWPLSTVTAPLGWLGRHSLTIYLIHQPLLFALLIPILGLTGFGQTL